VAVQTRAGLDRDARLRQRDHFPGVYETEGTVIMSSLLRFNEAPRDLRTEPVVDEQARRWVEAERLRIARELHDVVSYGLATISLQAGVAAHMADSSPEQAVDALHAIRAASREVLDEMRGILGQLRADDAAAEPARGIGRLSVLAERTSSAGVQTSVNVSGRPRPISIAHDLAVYRIVQEALANVLRHSPRAMAWVSVEYTPRSLIVTIEDNGIGSSDGASTEGSGYGITGMRERATALGGTVEAGPRPGGGFRVRASLPFLRRS
jgi:signal transduction histidine kinase